MGLGLVGVRFRIRVRVSLVWLGPGVTADLVPPRIDPPGPNPLADMVPPGQNPPADLDPLSRIWSPLQKRYHSAEKRISHTLDA